MNANDPQANRERAVEAIAEAFDAIEAEGRQPDDWEKMQLASALNSVFRGAYLLALSQSDLAMVPKHRRAQVQVRLDPQIADLDLARFRQVLQEAQAEPVRPFAFFGTWLAEEED